MLHRVRVALPDRPGALASVARVLAGAGADVLRVEVVDREAGRVVDEFGVELPVGRVRQLVVALERTPGVDVLLIAPSRRTSGAHPELDLLATAGAAATPVQAVCDLAPDAFGGEAAWVIDTLDRTVDASSAESTSDGMPPEIFQRLPLDRTEWTVRGGDGSYLAGARLGGARVLVVQRHGAQWYRLEVERLRRVAELAGVLVEARRPAAAA